MMRYGIAIFPSREIQNEANQYRKRYDPSYALIPPHITLRDSFQVDEEMLEDMISQLKHIANEVEPFTIEVKKVSTFAPVTNTIYFKIEPHETLTSLHEKMHEDFFTDHPKHSFVPHITIAQDLVTQEYSDVYGSLQMKEIQFEEEIDRFQLLYQLENGQWTVYETFVFGKEHV